MKDVARLAAGVLCRSFELGIEVYLMTTPSRNGYPQECVIDLHPGFDEGGPRLDNYLLKSTQKLDAITELVSRGEVADRDSRDWMLAQVDFIVETVGNDGLELGDELRS